MKVFYTLILVLLLSAAYGQSNLPACEGSNVSLWNNCFGNLIDPSGDKYLGEFKNGTFHGKGTYYYLAKDQFKGDKYVGEYKDDKKNGQGTYYYLANNQFKGDKYTGEFKNGNFNGQGMYLYANGDEYIGEFKDGLKIGQVNSISTDKLTESSGNFEENKLITPQEIDSNSINRISQNTISPPVSNNSTADKEALLELERQRLSEERRRLEEDKRHRELAKSTQRIKLQANSTRPNADGDVTINIQTNVDTASLKVNGEELGGRSDGKYSVMRVARAGQETRFEIYAKDIYGNTDTKTITVSRSLVDVNVTYQTLNPSRIKRQPERDAVAVIIGIEKYKRVAKADYANADAQDFYDYASRALGIKPENIKLLFDDGADDVEIYKAFQNWLPVKVNKGKTEVYIFYSGHGYPGQDGNSQYILPYGADKDLISKTAINQQEIITSIQNTQPKTVTIFLDSCYSGQTRGGDVLIVGARPIAPKISAYSYPQNFTVISASANDQISSASPDLKHGIFSYYLMKGMEGDADLNKDGKITVGEMQEYLTDMVGRQAMGMNRKQQPQLFGDAARVLVGR